MKLDKEEQEILAAFEARSTKVSITKAAAAKYAEYARNTLKKDRRINIRISERDLQKLQRNAVEQGMPYQTLIASVLHRYVSGGLVGKTV